VGLQVKNIRYFASQPWGLTSILMMGFFADVDGGLQPHPDGKELAEAVWMERKELLGMDDGISLTRALIQAFAEGKESVAVAG
jgi:NAD+ diphosphatase